MKGVLTGVVVILTLTFAGCGSGAKAPAKPEDTPKMTPEQVQEAYKKGMPENYMNKGPGGRPGGS